MRRIAFLLALALSAACAPKPATDTAPAPAGGAPSISSQMHGLWSGTAKKSPLGVQPYAISFRREGDGLIGETPPTLEEEKLPPGAYQRFHWVDGAPGTRLAYKTAMGEQGILEGELHLDATRSNAQKVYFCEPSACDSMELMWESLAPEKMLFQVRLDGRLHADIALDFDGDL